MQEFCIKNTYVVGLKGTADPVDNLLVQWDILKKSYVFKECFPAGMADGCTSSYTVDQHMFAATNLMFVVPDHQTWVRSRLRLRTHVWCTQ